MLNIVLAVVPSLLVACLMLWVNRGLRTRDALAAAETARIYELEKHAEACVTTFHALDVRMAKAETSAEGAKDSMEGLREFIEQRFEALNLRIDDALRRSSTPMPRKR